MRTLNFFEYHCLGHWRIQGIKLSIKAARQLVMDQETYNLAAR
jgi:hypothetical protein